MNRHISFFFGENLNSSEWSTWRCLLFRERGAAIGSAGGGVAYIQPSLGGASSPPPGGGDYAAQSPRGLEEAPRAGRGPGLCRGVRSLAGHQRSKVTNTFIFIFRALGRR